MKKTKKLFVLVVAVMLLAISVIAFTACKDKSNNDPETRPLSMSISTPDGVFNPFFSTSAYDSSVVGQTQIGMLSTDKEGNIVCGENEPTVALDYSVTEHKNGDNVDYTTYEFLIKNGIKFSDGVDLTIKDVLFNLYVYLDPAYTGSATIYSTDIVGLRNYRLQQEGTTTDTAESAFEEKFVSEANIRIDRIIEYVQQFGKGMKEADRPTNTYTEAQKKAILADYATVAKTFKEELETDWNNASAESYKEWGMTEKWHVFLYNDGGRTEMLQRDSSNKVIKVDGNPQLDKTEAQKIYDNEIKPYVESSSKSEEEAIKEFCINSVYNVYFPENDITKTNYEQFTTVVRYWATASTILDKFTAEQKSEYFKGAKRVVPTITGITTRKESQSFNGKDLSEEYDVLSIKINNVDPKAIYNFAFTVAPMHYYSDEAHVKAFDADTGNFGLEFGSIDFMNNVINASSKVGLPVGAGPYMASNASGNPANDKSEFFNNNMIYYQRNEYFATVGKELENAKIKYAKYKVVESDQIINALTRGDIDFGDPSATQENIAAVNEAGLAHVEIKTSGYGYVGINPRFVPNITVRRAIMKAMDTASITSNYYKGGLAEIIYRPMSTTNWAYPKEVKSAYSNDEVDYAYDSTGKEIKKMLEDEGYTLVNGVYEKNIYGYGLDKLTGTNYKLTIAGGSTDHPAYAMFLNAQKILNSIGFDVQVVTSQTALSDLSAGKLAIWAAAWSSTIDPDMYQVYHIDSQASSTSNWGYKQIKAGKSGAYATEYDIIVRLSEKIDEGRSTTDQEERKLIYKDALDLVMELAVEMPTYQRKDMSAFNAKVIKESSLTPEAERSPYNGLLSRIWEVEYV